MKSEDGPEEETVASAEEFLASLKEVMDAKRIVEQEDKVRRSQTPLLSHRSAEWLGFVPSCRTVQQDGSKGFQSQILDHNSASHPKRGGSARARHQTSALNPQLSTLNTIP